MFLKYLETILIEWLSQKTNGTIKKLKLAHCVPVFNKGEKRKQIEKQTISVMAIGLPVGAHIIVFFPF